MIHRAAVLGLLLVPYCSASAQENLLANPGFEEGDRAPESWSFNHRGTDGLIEWEAARAASGTRSVRLRNEPGQTGNVVQTIHLDPPLPAGSVVEFGAFAATEDAGDAPRIIVYLQPPAGDRQTVAATGIAGTHDFDEVTATAVTDRPVASIVVYLCHYGTGTIWWDDARVLVQRATAAHRIPRPEPRAELPALTTADGLSLTLSDAGAVSGVRVDDRELAQEGLPSGLWLQPWRGDLLPVAGASGSDDGRLAQTWEDAEEGLRVSCTWSVDGDAVRCEGAVADLTGEDRAVDLIAALPVGGEGWLWGESITAQIPLNGVPVVLNDLTFSALSGPDAALSIAVPAGRPSDCDFGWSPLLGYHVRFRFGLSPAASGELRSRAPFALTIRRIDPAWGLRDAARRYQAANPGAFEKRVEREGLWMFGQPRIELPDPESYAFHEGGPGGWEYDEEHGIYTCPYIIPGQREITRLESLPASPAEALELFRAWEPPQDDSRAARGWGRRDIIESCMLHNADGDPHVMIRNTTWGGNSVTFPMNANPWLFEGTDRATIGRVLLDYVASQHDETPALDGTYVDSLGAWGSFDNFRTEHFAAERVPLSYDGLTGRPVIPNRFTLLEFLWELGDLLHEREKLLFANGVHPNRRFHAFALDILGVEGRGRLEQKRTIAGAKPFLLLIYNIHEDPAAMEEWFNRCALWGIWPSFGNMRLFDTPEKYAPIAALNRRYVPALRAITAAGWQPITHARGPEGVLMERWGPDEDGAIYLTLFAEEATEAALRIDGDALGLGGALTARDMLTGEEFPSGGGGELALPLEARRVRVLELRAG